MTALLTKGNRNLVETHFSKMASSSTKQFLFYKLIVESVIQDKKLDIPRKFIKKFGDELSSVATLSTPCGNLWHIGLEKEGKKLWFSEGWEEFIHSYSLSSGHFLIFRYEGGSKFSLNIYDLNTSEIKYLDVLNRSKKLNHTKHCLKTSHKRPREDDSIANTNHNTTHPASVSLGNKVSDECNAADKSCNSNFSPSLENSTKDYFINGRGNSGNGMNAGSMKKIMKPADGEDDNGRASLPLVGHESPELCTVTLLSSMDERLQNLTNTVRDLQPVRITCDVGIQVSESEFDRSPAEFDSSSLGKANETSIPRKTNTQGEKHNMQESSSKHTKKGKSGKCNFSHAESSECKIVSMPKEMRARELAAKFSSVHPFCQVYIQSVFARDRAVLKMPPDFSVKYLKGVCGLIRLEDCDGKQWAVRVVNTRGSWKLTEGWHEFVKYNQLEEGNICSFELIEAEDVVLRVTIFRDLKDAGAANQINSVIQVRQRAIRAAAMFKSNNPFCRVILLPSCTYDKKLYMPTKFAEKYLTSICGLIKLEVSDGSQWSVKIMTNRSGTFLTQGWNQFVEDLKLFEGDICIFEFTKPEAVVLRVAIFRDAENVGSANHSESNLQLPLCPNDLQEVAQITTGKHMESSEEAAFHTPWKKHKGTEVTNLGNQETDLRICEPLSKRRKESRIYKSKPEKYIEQRSPTFQEKGKALKAAAAFKSKNPFCIIAMHQTYLMRRFLPIPSTFANRYLKANCGFIKLQGGSEGKHWSVRILKESMGTSLGQGWYRFVQENNLEEGDVCIFELIKSKVFKVSIFRVGEDS